MTSKCIYDACSRKDDNIDNNEICSRNKLPTANQYVPFFCSSVYIVAMRKPSANYFSTARSFSFSKRSNRIRVSPEKKAACFRSWYRIYSTFQFLRCILKDKVQNEVHPAVWSHFSRYISLVPLVTFTSASFVLPLGFHTSYLKHNFVLASKKSINFLMEGKFFFKKIPNKI